jgi:hypothetical protein
MRDHGLAHLRRIVPLGYAAAQASRERQRAQAHWEQTGEVLPLHVAPTQTPEAPCIEDLQQRWEQHQWQTQRDFLSW